MPKRQRSPDNDGDADSSQRLFDVLREAAQVPNNNTPSPVRQGQLGSCIACKTSVASHFDASGRFLGCCNATDNTTFVLVPIDAATGRIALNGALPSAPMQIITPLKPGREFIRARYTATLPDGKSVKDLDLSEHRSRALSAVVHSGERGIIQKDVIKKSGLPHGSVAQALNWLREHNLVAAIEDFDRNHKG